MKKTKTSRGFGIIKFKDSFGSCSLQESSASGPMIWLGHDENNIKVFVPGQSWVFWSDDDLKHRLGGTEINANTRMHLTRKQVKALIPHLVKFVETGNI